MSKEQKKLIIALAALVILIALASVLYLRLGEKYKPSTLVTQGGKETSAAEVVDGGDTVTLDLSSGETDAPETTDNKEEAGNDNLAPDFTMTDPDGNSIRLSDLRGKPTVLNFWASWCPPCQSEMPDFDSAFKQYGEDINFVMLNVTDGVRETTESARAFIENKGYTFPVYFDTELEGSIAYGASSIPLTLFIDAKGGLVAYGMGALDASALESGISMIFE